MTTRSGLLPISDPCFESDLADLILVMSPENNIYTGLIIIDDISSPPGLPVLEEGNIRVIRYDDCQQLVIYLPEYFSHFEEISITAENNTIIYHKKISEIINGSIQILIDSLSIPPGPFTISITRADGSAYSIKGHKQPGNTAQPPAEEENNSETTHSAFRIYRDGAGNIIPNEDEIIRLKAAKNLEAALGRRLTYTGNLRSGTIIYHDGLVRLEFYTEMGGGDCLFYVDIPGAG